MAQPVWKQAQQQRQQETIRSAAHGLMGLGLWLALAPFVLGYAATALAWNDLLLGPLLLGLAGWLAARPLTPYPGLGAIALGLWVAAIPFWALEPDAARISHFFTGLAVMGLGSAAALAQRPERDVFG